MLTGGRVAERHSVIYLFFLVSAISFMCHWVEQGHRRRVMQALGAHSILWRRCPHCTNALTQVLYAAGTEGLLTEYDRNNTTAPRFPQLASGQDPVTSILHSQVGLAALVIPDTLQCHRVCGAFTPLMRPSVSPSIQRAPFLGRASSPPIHSLTPP